MSAIAPVSVPAPHAGAIPGALPAPAVAAPQRLTGGEPAPDDLRRRSVRGGAATLAAQALRVTLQFGSTAALARMLSPRDYGLIAMVTAVTGFVAIFKDLGLSAATVQRRQVTQRQVNALFWINVGCSLLLMLAVMAAAPLIAWVYQEPQLKWVAIALAGNFVFGGLTAQHQALLRRHMKFTALARIDVAAMACGVAAALVAAASGMGYWSLVLQFSVQSAAYMTMAWIASPWMPTRPSLGGDEPGDVRSMLRFGGALTGFNIVNYFTRNADNVLIGWFWGAGLLGLYGKAYQLLMLPMNQLAHPVSSVVLPALSRLQDDPKRYVSYYRKAMLPLAVMSMPIVAFMTVDAHPIVRFVLGEKWMDAAVLFQLLAPAALVGGLNVATGWVYQSLGRADRQLRWGVLTSIATVAAFAVALPYGVWAVAAAFSATVCLLRYPGIVYCFRGTPLHPRDLLAVMWRPFAAALVAALGVLLLRQVFLPRLAIAQLALDGLVFAALYLGTWLALPGGRTILINLAGLLRELRSRKEAQA